MRYTRRLFQIQSAAMEASQLSDAIRQASTDALDATRSHSARLVTCRTQVFAATRAVLNTPIVAYDAEARRTAAKGLHGIIASLCQEDQGLSRREDALLRGKYDLVAAMGTAEGEAEGGRRSARSSPGSSPPPPQAPPARGSKEPRRGEWVEEPLSTPRGHRSSDEPAALAAAAQRHAAAARVQATVRGRQSRMKSAQPVPPVAAASSTASLPNEQSGRAVASSSPKPPASPTSARTVPASMSTAVPLHGVSDSTRCHSAPAQAPLPLRRREGPHMTPATGSVNWSPFSNKV